MIDIHCHILPNVDDGSKSLDESIEMAKIAVKDGINIIINTSHYHLDSNFVMGNELENRVLEFNSMLKENSIDLNILIGNELYYSRDLIKNIDELDFYSLNKSKYILIEFPIDNVPENMEDIIYEFKVRGYIPVIAHVERYNIKDINVVYNYINYGALIQVNSSSIIGKFGKEIRSFTDILLTHNMVHLIGSDAHSSRRRKPVLKESYEYVKNIIGKDKADNIFYDNTNALIRNIDINMHSPIEYSKKNIFGYIRNLLK